MWSHVFFGTQCTSCTHREPHYATATGVTFYQIHYAKDGRAKGSAAGSRAALHYATKFTEY